MSFKLNNEAAQTTDIGAMIAAQAAAAAQAANGNGKNKPPAKIWLNPGIITTLAGESEQMFVSLEKGLPIDTMDESKGGKLGNAKNALRQHLLKLVEGKQPGESVTIMLPCQIRIVRDGEREVTVDSELEAAFAGIQVIG